ncbi:MAG TPA: polysaccharide biosynthesis/export family protein [Ferruginibacter sp.]|nr:polysaccharide biosynthesis/export family protein [Ferruginibacter sp.]
MYNLLFSLGKSRGLAFKCLIASVIVLLSTTACRTPKQLTSFSQVQNDTTISKYVSENLETKIRKGDNLGISINSLSMEENARFNSNIIKGIGEDANVVVPGYQVSVDGTIKMYRLGEIKVEGYTRKELAAYLQKELAAYLREPLVSVSYLNRKVTIMGGVSNPQVLNISGEQITIFDALATAGDITEKGRVDNVLIIRDNDSSKEFKRIDLQNHSIFNSPWYYLKANDIVYVTPDFSRVEREEKRRKLQMTLSLVASGASLLFLLLNRVL